ncbi:MAG: hypothetical protein ACFFD5_01985 [Candidatus Thorarchaeota archaeon]
MNNHTKDIESNQGYSGLFPDKCIKCKKTDVELTTFNYRTFNRKGSLLWDNRVQTVMKTLELPVCTSCRPEIERHPRIISKLLSKLFSDEEYMQEFRTKVEDKMEVLISKNQIIFYCPKCGAQRTALDDFCNSCGKDLRKLKRDLNIEK